MEAATGCLPWTISIGDGNRIRGCLIGVHAPQSSDIGTRADGDKVPAHTGPRQAGIVEHHGVIGEGEPLQKLVAGQGHVAQLHGSCRTMRIEIHQVGRGAIQGNKSRVGSRVPLQHERNAGINFNSLSTPSVSRGLKYPGSNRMLKCGRVRRFAVQFNGREGQFVASHQANRLC